MDDILIVEPSFDGVVNMLTSDAVQVPGMTSGAHVGIQLCSQNKAVCILPNETPLSSEFWVSKHA